MKHFNELSFQNNSDLLIEVQNRSKSNLKCCDCNSKISVDWVSINLLCVLCIKCSGAHRSLGSHISKIRSLTLDNFSTDEMKYLIKNNVCNEITNSIYESGLNPKKKIPPYASDKERLNYITQKYKLKQFIAELDQSIEVTLKNLVKAIQLNSLHLLQMTLAKSKFPLKDLCLLYNSQFNDTLFQFSLKHYEYVEGKAVFTISEFLMNNGMVIDFPLPLQSEKVWSKEAINYWKLKLKHQGSLKKHTNNSSSSSSLLSSESPLTGLRHQQEPIIAAKNLSSSSLPSLLESTIKDKSKNRWSLSYIPNPTHNLITIHKSLRRSRKDKK